MRKTIFISILSTLLLLMVSGCNKEGKTDSKIGESKEPVFTEEDNEIALEMIEVLNDNLALFEKEVNLAISNGDIEVGDNEVFTQKVDEIGNEIVLQPFLQKFPDSLISKRGDLKVTYTPKSTDDCTFGNCNFDSISVPLLQVVEKEWNTYRSDEFDASELVLSNVKLTYASEEDSELTSIGFVKGETGDLYFSFNPIVKSLNFNLEELDHELVSKKSDVPQDEVKAAQDEFRQEVKELLSKYPELQ